MRLADGTQLGRYRILQPLGRGGMGEVYRATDAQLGREVAIKVLPEHLAHDTVAKKRFEREAKAVAALNHPNILSIYDSGIDQGLAFAVTELLDGETLRSRIARSPLRWDKALEITIAVADGLAAAHSKGIIHRDLKPENIFLTTDGRIKILDFGLARLAATSELESMEHLPTVSQVTSPGSVMGTVPYMSPEQVRGDALDSRSDLFSLGSVLYEMISARRAFPGAGAAEVSAAILKDEPAQLTGIPPEGQRILLRCLEKNPEHRFHSAHDLAFALKDILSASSASNSSTVTEKRRFPVRQLSIAIAVLGIIALLVFWKVNGFQKKEPLDATFPKIQSLAVLPLDNLSRDDKEQYFADGMTEELIAKLARISSLRVISRTSVMEYKNAHKSLPQIAKELNVDAIVEGSILKAGNRVRITAQLIHAATDHHIWANSYEGDLLDIISLQNEVATSIAREVHVALAPEEAAHLAQTSQVNPDAYQAYLRGLNYAEGMIGPENIRLAVEMFQRAVDLDPTFASAYARLSIAEGFLYWTMDNRPEQLEKSKAALDKAFQLKPGFAEGHVAAGYYYYRGFRDYERALQEFAIAERDLPNDKSILNAQGTIHRRMGKWQEAVSTQRKLVAMNPREAAVLYDIAVTYSWMRDFPESNRYINQCIAVAPDETTCYVTGALNQLREKGDTKTAREILKRAPDKNKSAFVAPRFLVEFWERKYEAALEVLSTPEAEAEVNFAAATLGILQLRRNDPTSARAFFESTKQRVEKQIKDAPTDHTLRMQYGVALAGLGRKQEAIREAQLATEILPLSKDAMFGYYPVMNLAHVYIMTGENDAAIDQLEDLVAVPGLITTSFLRLDPRFDSLRNHPRFQKLVGTL